MSAAHRFFASRWGIIVSGGVIGVLAALLVRWGNPPNMGVCMACFERDIAGALGLHRAAVVQYLRPEIPAFLLGSTIAALIFGEFRSRGGSSPLLRFLLGVFAMVGALVFLGCPWRALLRLAGGDGNAIIGLAGLVAGIAVGVRFLKAGYSLGRSHPMPAAVGWVIPGAMIGLLLLAVFQPKFSEGGPIFASGQGPGSLHAALAVSVGVGLVIGFLAQRTRFCTMGAVRDVILIRDTHLLGGVLGLVVAAFATNLVLGLFNPGFAAQPVSHSNHLWNFLGMGLAGLAFAMAGGCPGRQVFLAGEGDSDAGIFVLGMVTGAAFAHNFSLAGTADVLDRTTGGLTVGGPSYYGQVAVIIGLVVLLAIAFAMREQQAERKGEVVEERGLSRAVVP